MIQLIIKVTYQDTYHSKKNGTYFKENEKEIRAQKPSNIFIFPPITIHKIMMLQSQMMVNMKLETYLKFKK
jgi:hypothetical protein